MLQGGNATRWALLHGGQYNKVGNTTRWQMLYQVAVDSPPPPPLRAPGHRCRKYAFLFIARAPPLPSPQWIISFGLDAQTDGDLSPNSNSSQAHDVHYMLKYLSAYFENGRGRFTAYTGLNKGSPPINPGVVECGETKKGTSREGEVLFL